MPACTHCSAPMGDEFDADTNDVCSIRCAVDAGVPIDGATPADIVRTYAEELAEAVEDNDFSEEMATRGAANLLSWMLLGGNPADDLLRKQIAAWREGQS